MAVALFGLALLATACSHPAGKDSSGSTHPPATTPARSTTTTTTTTTTATPSTTAPSTVPVSSIGPLTTRTPPAGGYSVSLPASWQFTNSSVPSDHQTNTWSDPSDPNSSLTVVLSGCEGCVEASLTSGAPAPADELPAGATVTRTIAPWQIFYTGPASVSGYTDFGSVLVTHNGTAVTGFVKLDLVLPATGSAAADTVLGSFALT
jgi:hypothetical protein